MKVDNFRRVLRLPRNRALVQDTQLVARQGGTEASRMLSHIFASWNQLDAWLRQIDSLRRAA